MESTPALEVVQKNLQVLGIEPDTSRTYLELAKLGPTSALQLSKQTGISRTQIYRHLEQLQSHRLVSAEQLSYGTLFRALPLENIETIISIREAETADIKNNVQAMADSLRTLTGAAGPQSTTTHFYGLGGFKQISWNLAQADGEYKTYTSALLPQRLDSDSKAFIRRCRERYIERQLVSYSLTNAASVSAKELGPIEPSRTHLRRIDPELLKINFELYLYNDIVTLVDFAAEQLQATEIHHPALKIMLTQLFDSMWNIAEPLEIK